MDRSQWLMAGLLSWNVEMGFCHNHALHSGPPPQERREATKKSAVWSRQGTFFSREEGRLRRSGGVVHA